MLRTVLGAAIYFALVFAVGLALGPVRVLALEPAIGTFLATLIEAPFLIAAMIFAAHYAPRWAHMARQASSLALMGGLALCLQQSADYLVGIFLRGLSVEEQLAQFRSPAGWVYAGTLAAFALMPLALHVRRLLATAKSHGWTFKLTWNENPRRH